MNVRSVQVPWNVRLEKLLEDMNPLIGVPILKKAVDEEKIAAFEVIADEVSIGFILVRIESLFNGDIELVVMHALSEIKGRSPLSHIVSVMLPDVAKHYGAKSIRIHSDMRKMDDFLEREGFRFMESIFVKKVGE